MHTMPPHQQAEYHSLRPGSARRRGWFAAAALVIVAVPALALWLPASTTPQRDTAYVYRIESIPFSTKTVKVAYLRDGDKRAYSGYAGVRKVLREVTYDTVFWMKREVSSRVIKAQVIK